MSLKSSAMTLARQYFPSASKAVASRQLPFTSPRLTSTTPDAFTDLVADLTQLLRPYSGRDASEINHKALASRMQSYRTQRRDWEKFALVDPRCNYTRNLVDRGHGWSNLLLLVWKPGVGSSVHDHSGAHCVMKILQGTLRESLYDWPAGEEPPRLRHERGLAKDEVGYMSDDIGLHKISNPDTLVPAVSLHLYTPPWAQQRGCHVFGERTGEKCLTRQSFFSEYGKVCREEVER